MYLKKAVLWSLLLVITMTGCTKSDITGPKEQLSETEDLGKASYDLNSYNNNQEDNDTERYDHQWEVYREYVSSKPKEQIELDEESESLYKSFIEGKTKAVFDADGDITRHLRLSEVLVDGQSYSLIDIEQTLSENSEYGENWFYENNVKESYIDLGLDSTYELKLDIGAMLNLTLVVKNVDGELIICFSGDATDITYTDVQYSGNVFFSFMHSYLTHDYEKGFIDADGKYHLLVLSSEEGYNIAQDGDLVYNEQLIGKGIGMYIQKCSLNRDYTEPFYVVYIVDKENLDILEDKSDSQDPYRLAINALAEEGIEAISADEADKMLDEKRHKMGYNDELYYYGYELKPIK
ncbi:hypothetical protein SAMN02910298_02745 [Pseudobutyrivibrio sp. YE44]|uniref:hypothetical protein n=1 Tax=Pseudobutyrivibrio sp. YE44 TaxID=1520802 RepID=UPI00088CA43B|nr:hypothetical protein [Pseudobutyrivibrio sp. YE44]SDB53650.1 hypothetical protein SAMN02910298_02745 [Pseudobutyrivibrio sp. YE44]